MSSMQIEDVSTKWVASLNDEDFSLEYESKEAALKTAPMQFNLQPGGEFYVAPLVQFVPKLHVDDVFLSLLEEVDHVLGDEAPEDFLDPSKVSTEAKNELEKALNDVLTGWLKKHNLEFSDQVVAESEKIVVT